MARKKAEAEQKDVVGEAIPIIMGITRKLAKTVLRKNIDKGMDNQTALLAALRDSSVRSFADAMNEFAGKRDAEFYITSKYRSFSGDIEAVNIAFEINDEKRGLCDCSIRYSTEARIKEDGLLIGKVKVLEPTFPFDDFSVLARLVGFDSGTPPQRNRTTAYQADLDAARDFQYLFKECADRLEKMEFDDPVDESIRVIILSVKKEETIEKTDSDIEKVFLSKGRTHGADAAPRSTI